jgi:hypothetical protein
MEVCMLDSVRINRRRQRLADTLAQLKLPLEVLNSPDPPSDFPWRAWQKERAALQGALKALRRALADPH